MPAQPANPQPTEDVRVSRKRQVPLDANGEPVTGSVPKKQKSAPEKTGKKKAAPAKAALQKKAASKSVAADGSNDDNDNPHPAAMDVDADADNELEEVEVEIVEVPEVDDEAELGPY